jgi:dihydroorotate dehydrogenase
MKDIDFLPNYEGPGYSGPALKLAAGVTVREVYEAADKHDVTVTGAVSWVSGSFSLFKGSANEGL